MSADLSEAQRRALAARLAAAEGALLVLDAYVRLARRSAPAAASVYRDVLQGIHEFSITCDDLYSAYALPETLRDRRLPVAEQLGRLEAALEDVRQPEQGDGVPPAGIKTAFADLHLAVGALLHAAQGMQPLLQRPAKTSPAE